MERMGVERAGLEQQSVDGNCRTVQVQKPKVPEVFFCFI